jgi:nicotinate phosphoribosyltransferase
VASARAPTIAGFAGTSNVEAARRLALPAMGTMAHSYVEAFASEREAFRTLARDFPDRTTFLVDTYDTITGTKTAIEVINELGMTGPVAVRLDSGDLLTLSLQVRRLLDGAGCGHVKIVASGGLDEWDIDRLLGAGAPIDLFGVGTKVGVSADAPSLDTAYKLVEYDGRPVMKLSPGKETMPGAKQVFRRDPGVADVLSTRSEPCPPQHRPLLQLVMRAGRPTAPPEPVTAAAQRLAEDLDHLPAAARRLDAPVPPPQRISDTLRRLTDRTRRLSG